MKRSAKAAASLMYCARMSASWARPCSAEVSSTSSGLIKLDLPTIVKMGAHPLVPFLAQLQMKHVRP